jgi:dolichol-phosphate mannosyltransferase
MNQPEVHRYRTVPGMWRRVLALLMNNAVAMRAEAEPESPATADRIRVLPGGAPRYRYDIDGVIAIDSAVALPELAIFRTESPGEPDLIVNVGRMGGLSTRAHATILADDDHLLYREHLGGLFANFKIENGRPITVTASPVLARSPHVLYTNVVEALLRFLMVKRGRVLLHAACLDLFGEGVLLSAKTDTGKTSTILRLLHHHGGSFLSDDMIIVDEHGMANRYPKPLTISAHTLRSVPSNRLGLRQRAVLQVQSRVHSKSGRGIGQWLARSNVPIMSINSLVQIVIPPPKYMITDLVSCEIHQQIKMSRFFLIERGPRLISYPTHEEALEVLLSNTEDAYGFPPYAQLAPKLVIGGDDYDELRRAEKEILAKALSSVSITRVRLDDFSWDEVIIASQNGNGVHANGNGAHATNGNGAHANGNGAHANGTNGNGAHSLEGERLDPLSDTLPVIAPEPDSVSG